MTDYHYYHSFYFPFSNFLAEVCILLYFKAKQLLKCIRLWLKLELFFSVQSRRLSIMLTRRKNYQRWIPRWEKQCIRFSKRCRYQHFWIAWPGPAFPLTYLSSQELAPGKKWWKATQYLNASRPNKFSLLFGFDMNIEKPPSEVQIVVWRRSNGRLLMSAL